jgi:hypothetical protein
VIRAINLGANVMQSPEFARLRRRVASRTRLLAPAAVIALLAVLLVPSAALANDAHLTIVKTFDHPTAMAGDTIGFTITVQVHPDPGPDALCVILVSGQIQCPAHHVVVVDQLPATPAGLQWSIDAAHSSPGCDIGITTPGVLTCTWGSLIAENETRTVHVVSPTVGGPGGTCGAVVNQVATVTYMWEDGTALKAEALDAKTVVRCPAVTPSPRPTATPTPQATVGATATPAPHITLPPTDAVSLRTGRQQAGQFPLILLALGWAAGMGALFALRHRSSHR